MVAQGLPTVIVSDPDPAYRQYLAALLVEGFRCLTTSGLRETYYAIVRERPCLLILELNQPDGDGLSLIQYLQADPALKQILIACVTQRGTMRDKVLAFRAGADDYLVKPLSTPTFFGQMLLLRRAGHQARAYAVRNGQLTHPSRRDAHPAGGTVAATAPPASATTGFFRRS